MTTDLVKKPPRNMSKGMKELIEAQTAKMMDIIPNVIDQYKHDIDMAGKLQRHIAGDNLVNPSPVLTDPRAINDFLKRVDVVKLLLLKAAGLVAPAAANIHIQQVFNNNQQNILSPELFGALGGFLDLDDDVLPDGNTEDEISQNCDTVSFSDSETVEDATIIDVSD